MDLPVRWQAPETLMHHHFSTASDVYSFGVLVYEVLTYGCTPYRNVLKDEEVLKRVSDWDFETRTRERIFSLIMNVIDNTKFLKHSRSTRLWCIPCDTIQSLKTGATFIIVIIIIHFYSAHIHYLSEALYKIISKTTIIKFRNKKIKN